MSSLGDLRSAIASPANNKSPSEPFSHIQLRKMPQAPAIPPSKQWVASSLLSAVHAHLGESNIARQYLIRSIEIRGVPGLEGDASRHSKQPARPSNRRNEKACLSVSWTARGAAVRCSTGSNHPDWKASLEKLDGHFRAARFKSGLCAPPTRRLGGDR